MTDQARTMFKALEDEIKQWTGPLVAGDEQFRSVMNALYHAIARVNREADALAAHHSTAPSNEGAGVAGASVSRPVVAVAEAWLAAREVPADKLNAAVILDELRRLRKVEKWARHLAGSVRAHERAGTLQCGVCVKLLSEEP